jgi:FAD-dependent urate hydroxylase
MGAILTGNDYGWRASRSAREAHFANRHFDPARFAQHEERVVHDLTCLNYPASNWVPPCDGVVDVLVIGAGMCGQTAAYALQKEGVRNIRVIDQSPPQFEGPWGTFARMEILRSPKHLTGPDLGVPSLTFRAWFEARYGGLEWSKLHKVWRLDWQSYLVWVRQMVGLQVENSTALLRLTPATGESLNSLPEPGLLQATLQTPNGAQTVLARKVLLAMGREGSGAPRLPQYPSLTSTSLNSRSGIANVFHSMDKIDFQAFRGKHVGVLGVGASAFDNAACVLESGGAVTMFCRRSALPQVNKSKWTAFGGFFKGFAYLTDAQRWEIYSYIFDEQVPPPFESVQRCERWPLFKLCVNENWVDVQSDAAGVKVTSQPNGVLKHHEFDAVIFGTGFDVNMLERPELEYFAKSILTWQDRIGDVMHPSGVSSDGRTEAGRFPYLSDRFTLLPNRLDAPPELNSIYVFNWGATISQGAVAGDIPGLAHGATKLAASVARDLFAENISTMQERLLQLAEPELALTSFYKPKT